MSSLDVYSLFTNIHLDKTIKIKTGKLFSENETGQNLNKDQFKCLLILATKESCFIFDGELYQQVDGVAMGSTLVPTLAIIVFCRYEDIWLHNCSLECKPSYRKRYADDIFVLFESETQVVSFKDFMNTCHPKMKLTFEKRQKNCFNFLFVKVIREDNFLPPRFTVNLLSVVFTRILIITCH